MNQVNYIQISKKIEPHLSAQPSDLATKQHHIHNRSDIFVIRDALLECY